MGTFKFRNGFNRYVVTAQVAGDELERISNKKSGRFTSADVVDESRPDDAPLHPVFEWDDRRAAESYRVHQASTLIRAVTVVPEKASDHVYSAFVQVKPADEPKPVYVHAVEVVKSPVLFADAIDRLERNLSFAARSANELRELAASYGDEPERLARIALAVKAIEAASSAVSALSVH